MRREDLEGVPSATEVLRSIRFITDDDLADVTPAELERAARWLRAAAHSCREGARRLDQLIAHRSETPCPASSPVATTASSAADSADGTTRAS